MMTLILIAAILLLTIASSFFSLSEIAFFSLPATKVRSYRHHLSARKRQIAKLLRESKNLLVTIFLLNTIVNILVQNLSSDLFSEDAGSWLLKVGIPLVLILVFGELVPKYLGLLFNEQVAEFSAPFYEWFQKISAPLRHAIYHVANFFSRLLFFYMKVEKPLSEEELEHIVQTSEGKGLLHEEEARLLKGYMTLEEKQARDIMLPRNILPAYDMELPLSKLIFLFSEKNLEAVPVCKNSLDNFLGMLDATSFFIHRSEIKNQENLRKYLYQPFFTPETTSLKLLLEQMQRQEEKIVLVVDEYGAISGSVTKKEIIRAVFKTEGEGKGKGKGSAESTTNYVKVAKDSIIANGTMPLDELADLFDEKLESVYHAVTIGGYLSEKLGTIPQHGATYQEGELFFRVLEAEPTKIRKVYIQYQKEGKKTHP